MGTVLRTDRAALRKPVITSQGFYRADAHAARIGILEYRNDDGTVRRELRSAEEVSDPDSLASYDQAPVTIQHPRNPDGTPGLVTAENVHKLEVGSVAGVGRMDDDHVATTVVLKHDKAIRRAKAGLQELSPGYQIDLDETPGEDSRYGYPGNPQGRFDARQRKIRVNHVALVDHARAGSTTRLRIDSADAVARADDSYGGDDVDLTSLEKGHQHTINTCPSGTNWDGTPMSRDHGCTSYAVSDDAGDKGGHSHDWVRNADGSITIAWSDAHTHTILEDETRPVPAPGFVPAPGATSSAATYVEPQASARADELDRPGPGPEIGHMPTPVPPPDPSEQIRLLTVRADEADRIAATRHDALTTVTGERDGLRAELTTAKERVAALEAQIAAGAGAVENAAVHEQRTRADAAERELQKVRDQQPGMVRARASLVSKAQATIGPQFRCDSLTDREILVAGVRHLSPKEDVGPHVSSEYLTRRFDSLIEDRTKYGASLARASHVLSPPRAPAPHPAPAQTPWADQWTNGAGQFATVNRKNG